LKQVGSIVPSVEITEAKRLRWYADTGKRYQVQYAYDLTSVWYNHGSVIQGNNTVKTVYDTSHEATHKFWRIVIDP
jgi:hypothetical protein